MLPTQTPSEPLYTALSTLSIRKEQEQPIAIPGMGFDTGQSASTVSVCPLAPTPGLRLIRSGRTESLLRPFRNSAPAPDLVGYEYASPETVFLAGRGVGQPRRYGICTSKVASQATFLRPINNR